MLGDLADACGRSSLFLMAASDAAEAIRTILRIQETKKQNKTKLQRNKRFLTSVIRYVHIRSGIFSCDALRVYNLKILILSF